MQEQVVGALRNVCNQHTGSMHFAECDGVSSMMRLLSSPSDIVQEEVVGLIRNACVGYYGNKDHMTQCGAFWSFSQMMNDPHCLSLFGMALFQPCAMHHLATG